MAELPVETTVLVVEEGRSLREVIRDLLSRAQFRVVACADGPAALEVLESGREKIGLILLDLQLPMAGGFDLIKWLRSRPTAERPPILAMTGALDMAETIRQLQGLEAVGIQDKRTISDQLTYRVRALLCPAASEQRAAPRSPAGLPVNIRVGGAARQGSISNISRRGIFLLFEMPIPIGTDVHFQFILPGIARLFEGTGRVVWLAEGIHAGAPSGMGIEFVGLDEMAQGQIAAFVQMENQRFGVSPRLA